MKNALLSTPDRQVIRPMPGDQTDIVVAHNCEDAERVARALNSHDELLTQLRRLTEIVEVIADRRASVGSFPRLAHERLQEARAAIADAEVAS